jgi:dTDP-4-dehydrorhamnose reductase
MLGHKLVQQLARRHNVKFTLRGKFESVEKYCILHREDAIEFVDALDFETIRNAVVLSNPDVVINAMGIVKQVAEAEDVVNTLTVNSILPHRLSQLSNELGFRLITMSTDCVFLGSRGLYVENDIADAIDLYGQSKHWGEVDAPNSITLRTSIIGRELSGAHGLLEWFISNRGKSVKGYSRAIFSGFPTIVLADIILDIIETHRELKGVFHISSEPISKFDLLTKVNERFGLDVEISDAPEIKIDRSLDSTKYRNQTGFVPLTWDEMIERLASEDVPYDRWKQVNN